MNLRQTVQRIRDWFEPEELDVLKWIQVFANIADVLTKHNPNSYRLMSHVLSTGTLDLPKHNSFSLDISAGSDRSIFVETQQLGVLTNRGSVVTH